MSGSIVQETQTSAGSTSVPSISLAFASNNTAGNAIHVFGLAGNSGRTFTVSDTQGNTYSVLDTNSAVSGGNSICQAVAVNIKGGANTVTVTFSSAAGYPGIWIREIGGVSASPVDGHILNVPNVINTSVSAAATNAAQPGIWSGFAFDSSGGLSATTGTQDVSGWLFGGATNEAISSHGPVSTVGTQTAAFAGTSSSDFLASIVIFDAATGSSPTVTSVNGGSSIAEGATNVAVVGTNFASGMTADITQPGSVVVSQPFTYTSSTNGTFNLSMEPGTGDQLAFTDSTYTTGFDVTVSGATSTPIAVTLVPPTGLIFQTLSSINTTSAYTITATPSLAVGDQLEAAGNSTGTAAAPAGLTLNADATFTFASGNTPTNFYVRAYDGTNKVWGAWALQTVTVTVTLSPTTLPAATAGTAYSQTLTASGGTSPYTFSVTSGALPAGLSLSSGGVLSGTPTVAGSFSFTVTATDSASHTGSQAYTLTVAANIVVSPSSVGNGVVGVAYSQTLSASDGVSPYTYAVTAGALPTGLSLSSAGAITGTPTTVGTYSFTVTATDANSNTGSQAYSGVTISAAPAFTRRGLGTLGVGS